MSTDEKILEKMLTEPANMRFSELQRVCETYFGKPRQNYSNHAIYKTPWPGNPRVNILNNKGKARPIKFDKSFLPLSV